MAVPVGKLLVQMDEERIVERHSGDCFGGRTEQQGKLPGSTKTLVRVGACP